MLGAYLSTDALIDLIITIGIAGVSTNVLAMSGLVYQMGPGCYYPRAQRVTHGFVNATILFYTLFVAGMFELFILRSPLQ